MLNFKQGPGIVRPLLYPQNIDFLRDSIDCFPAGGKSFAALESICDSPVQTRAIVRWNPNIVSFRAADGTEKRLYLGVRQIGKRVNAGRTYDGREIVPPKVTFDTKCLSQNLGAAIGDDRASKVK